MMVPVVQGHVAFLRLDRRSRVDTGGRPRGWRLCARWFGFLFLLAGAAIPPPLRAQVPARRTVIIVHWNTVTTDTFALDQAPAKIVLSLVHDSTGAHLVCGISYVTAGANPFPFVIRWAGDSIRRVVGTWRPYCLSP